jgi:hypothetical protein
MLFVLNSELISKTVEQLTFSSEVHNPHTSIGGTTNRIFLIQWTLIWEFLLWYNGKLHLKTSESLWKMLFKKNILEVNNLSIQQDYHLRNNNISAPFYIYILRISGNSNLFWYLL